MRFEAHTLYHLYNRGNDGMTLFYGPADYGLFLRKIRHSLLPHCQLLAYCLMPNHFHLLLYPGTEAAADLPLAGGVPRSRLAGALSTVLSSFSQGLNQELGRTGGWFEGRTQARELATDRYAAWCLHYLHQNPVRAGLTLNLADWAYCSYRDYAALRSGTLCDLTLGRQLLDMPLSPFQFQQESQQAIDPEMARSTLYGRK